MQRIRNLKKQIAFKASVADYVISDDEDSDSDSDIDSNTDSDSEDSSSAEEEVKEKMKQRQLKQRGKSKGMQLKNSKKAKGQKDGNSDKTTKSSVSAQKKTEEKGKSDESLTEETEGLDQKATRWMMIVMVPIIIGYGIYSFWYHKHKSIISFIINVAASCVYGLGFIHLTPQLFINYELQSVDSLPWKVLIYKFFNTFVDDLFSFVIDMPLMHRLACFRVCFVSICETIIVHQWVVGVD